MSNTLNMTIVEEVLRIRLSQVLINEEYKAGKFKVPVHLALGHEAIAVALNHVLQDGDKLILSHRNAAYNLARLRRLKPILDEYLLKPEGLAGGKLGSMNLIQPEKGLMYSSSILGNNFPVAVGITMAEKLRASAAVTFVLGGDGSMEEGSFYESLVMAKTLGVKLVLIIENNEWSLGTHISERRCPIDLGKLTASVGIPYTKFEGNHVHTYFEKLASLREETLREAGPMCVEVVVKTLGDRWVDQTPEEPQGRYINYHAGPAPTIEVQKLEAQGGIIYEDENDPVFVLSQEIGKETLLEISKKIMEELREEMTSHV